MFVGETIRPAPSYSTGFCLAVAAGNRQSNVTSLSLYEEFMPPPSWFGSRDYNDRHGSFFSHGGQWFFVMNDESHSLDPAAYFFRDSVAAYVHYRSDGTIAPLVVTRSVSASTTPRGGSNGELHAAVRRRKRRQPENVGEAEGDSLFEVQLEAGGAVEYPNIGHSRQTSLRLRAVAQAWPDAVGQGACRSERAAARAAAAGRRQGVWVPTSTSFAEHDCLLDHALGSDGPEDHTAR